MTIWVIFFMRSKSSAVVVTFHSARKWKMTIWTWVTKIKHIDTVECVLTKQNTKQSIVSGSAKATKVPICLFFVCGLYTHSKVCTSMTLPSERPCALQDAIMHYKTAWFVWYVSLWHIDTAITPHVRVPYTMWIAMLVRHSSVVNLWLLLFLKVFWIIAFKPH